MLLNLTNLHNVFCWVAFFGAKIMLLLLRNNKFALAKSIKLISFCNEEWLEWSSAFKTLISDFWWRIFSFNNFNLHCLYLEEVLRDFTSPQHSKAFWSFQNCHHDNIYAVKETTLIVDKKALVLVLPYLIQYPFKLELYWRSHWKMLLILVNCKEC